MIEDNEDDIDMPDRFLLEPEYVVLVKKGKEIDKIKRVK